MLKELKLSNFRHFNGEITVLFRPITILIGKNNSGKSSVIKFLLMLKQSLFQQSQLLVTHGNDVDLGSFYDLKNKITKRKTLAFSLTVKGDTSPPGDILSLFSKGTDYSTQIKCLYNMQGKISGEQELKCYSDSLSLESASKLVENSSLLNEIGKIRPSASSTNEVDLEQNALKYCLEMLRLDVTNLRHLAAAKADLERSIDVGFPYANYVQPDGKNTLKLMYQKIIQNSNNKEFLDKHVKKVLELEKINFPKPQGDYTKCLVNNINTGAKGVNIADCGFGVSQCLPIFVQGILMPQKSHLIAEQPEAQVHPSAQLALGSFFAELWKKRNVGSIVETHSNNLLMRLRRLVTCKYLSKEDISIAYFTHRDNDPTTPAVINLSISESGQIEPPKLPMEFFNTDINEAIGIELKEPLS